MSKNTKQAATVVAPQPPAPPPLPGYDVDGRWLHCHRTTCETSLDVSGMTPEAVHKFAQVTGFVQCLGNSYCSKLCATIDTASAGDGGYEAKPKQKADAVPIGLVNAGRGVLRCGRGMCGTELPVGNMSAEQATRMAEVSGFVRNELGLFCSAHCARRASVDAAAGVLKSMTSISDLGRQ